MKPNVREPGSVSRGAIAVLCAALVGLSAFVALPETAGAAVFSTNVRVNTVTTQDQKNASLALGPDGTIHVVWEDLQFPGPRISAIFYAKSTDGGKHFMAGIPVVSPVPASAWQKLPSVAVSTNGWIQVTWTDLTALGSPQGAGLHYARSQTVGASFESAVQVSDLAMDDAAEL